MNTMRVCQEGTNEDSGREVEEDDIGCYGGEGQAGRR